MRFLYFDVWQDQHSTLIQEHGAALPDGQGIPMILIAVLRAKNSADAWLQLDRLRPYEMPRFYDIWEEDGAISLSVQPLMWPEKNVVHTFWAETSAAAREEFQVVAAQRGLNDT